MQNSVITAALASYISSMTRFVITKSPVDLDLAKCSVRWINSELELYGMPLYRTTGDGLLKAPYLLDQHVCRSLGFSCQQRWFVADMPLDFYRHQSIAEFVKQGDLLVLNSMKDSQSPGRGAQGTVRYVDDAGQIHVTWNTGSTLAVILEVDDVSFLHAA